MLLPKRIIRVTVQKKDNTLITVENDFRISFNIKKTYTSDKNTCQLTIYNLSNETRNKLNEIGALVTVYAGYNEPEIIFVGDIYYTSTKKSFPDIQFIIEIKD